ncbi:unnamed protein product, partial [Didymodactylos carnosus]
TQIKIPKPANRLRLLIEQENNNSGKRLHLKGRDTYPISNDLYELTDLEILDLTPEYKSGMAFTISKVPPEFQCLKNLKILHLDNNNITSLPKEIGELHNLERFTISNNHLRTLPNELRYLNKLQSIHLSNNHIEEFPLSICYLNSLTFLDLCYNILKKLPKSIQHLKRLKTLLLLGNKLQRLPNELCQLSVLETLWIGENHITQLPVDFHLLNNLDWKDHYLSSNYDGNPLIQLPLTVYRKDMTVTEQHPRK